MTSEIANASELKRLFDNEESTGDYPAYPRDEWVESKSSLDYWDWVRDCLVEEYQNECAPRDVD